MQCNAMYNRPRYHLHWFHDSLFLPNRRQIKDNRTKQKSHLLQSLREACCMIGCGLLQSCSWPAVTSDHSPAPANQSRSRRAGGEDSLQPGPSGASSGHTGTVRSGDQEDHDILITCPRGCPVFDHPECIVKEKNTCHRVMQQTRTKNAEIF